MAVFRKILLLLWKNFLFRRRQFIATPLEVILPTLMLSMLAWNYSNSLPEDRIVKRNGEVNPLFQRRREDVQIFSFDDTTYSVVFEEDLLNTTRGHLSADVDSVILFAPNTSLAEVVMERVMRTLGTEPSRAKGFSSEAQIEQRIKDYNKKAGTKHFSWGRSWNDPGAKKPPYPYRAIVVFDGAFNWDVDNPPAEAVVSYKLRMISFGDESSSGVTRSATKSTEHQIFSYPLHPGSGYDAKRDEYRRSGFTGLQIALDKTLIWILSDKTDSTQKIQTQAMPYPKHSFIESGRSGVGEKVANEALSLSLNTVLGFFFIVVSVIRNVVSEKETGIKELMKMMGLPNWMHWLGWLMNSLSLLLISITLITIIVFAPFGSEGGILINADFTLWFIVLLLFVTTTVCFSFLLSTFFRRPALALTVGIILYIGTFFTTAILLTFTYQTFSLYQKLAFALIPNAALHLAIMSIFYQELTGGARWSTLFKGASVVSDDLTLGYVCLMLIFDAMLFMILTIYFENIIPSEFGLTKPWYYPVKMLYCRRTPKGRVTPEAEIADETRSKRRPGFEPEPTDLHAGVVIHNLRKEFGRHKVAVNMVGTLKMYDGQITALLGHNGAGKTTTLSILTGLFAPTSGTATVNGYDIKKNMDEVRHNLGLCPQENMFFSQLTVKEHLIFFGMLKGLTKPQAIQESQYLLWRMNLSEKIDVQAKALSGGQKRKLCLGIALIGGTKVVVLDEPTSGMDPEARRAIWDLLLGMRGERTIILTTHYMEEADVLSDRIAIMAEGQVICCGSPRFLRKYYGTGYTLKLSVADPAVRPRVLNLVQNYFVNASLKKNRTANTAELEITIPVDKNTNSVLPKLFSGIANEVQSLGIQTVGLSLATMDDIFIKVGEEVGIREDEVTNTDVGNETEEVDDRRHLTGCGLVVQQFYGIFMKRLLSSWRKRKLFFSQVFIPVGLLILCILISNSILANKEEEIRRPTKMKLSAFNNPVTMLQVTQQDLESAYRKVIGNSGQLLIEPTNLTDRLLDEARKNLEAYRNRYVVAGNLSNDNATALYSALPNHASPLSVNLMSNAILMSMTPPNRNYRIEVTAQPIHYNPRAVIVQLDLRGDHALLISYTFGPLMTIGLALLVASYVVSPVEERQCSAKQLQFMTGVNPAVYWTASFAWDFCSVLILTCIMLSCFAIFERNGIYMANHGGAALFLILMAYGFVGISFSYIFSTFFISVPGAFSVVTILHIQAGIFLALTYFAFLSAGFVIPNYAYFWRMFPSFGVTLAIMHFTSISVKNSLCVRVATPLLRSVCESDSDLKQPLKHCCPDCKEGLPNNTSGNEMLCYPESMFRWSNRAVYRHPITNATTTVAGPVITQEIVYMILVGLIYYGLLLLIEFGLFKRLFAKTVKADVGIFAQTEIAADEDVQFEKDRVNHLVQMESQVQDALVVANLCKSYGTFAAVSGLSFGVHYGECFGLLGVNGAGKTTTFRMLTGDEIRSFGTAYNMGLSLDENRAQFLSRLGYCPQFDGLVGGLTGKEMVNLFARLRGIPCKNIHSESKKWLFKVGLQESANVQCQKYSGGMKRRLCAAIALVGDPGVVLLDEPTTGVDPIARRKFWKVIDSVRRSGQAVVLTSHSMEECEALCSRLGIMVNGQFQCLGGVQHLKAKYAQGFKLVVTLSKAIPEQQQAKPQQSVQNVREEDQENEEEAEVQQPLPTPDRVGTDEERIYLLCDKIVNTYNPCYLRERHQRMLEFQVIGTGFRWGQMFEMMEGIRGKFVDLIEDYSITETTLEEVFLAFARMQYPEREVAATCIKRCCKC